VLLLLTFNEDKTSISMGMAASPVASGASDQIPASRIMCTRSNTCMQIYVRVFKFVTSEISR